MIVISVSLTVIGLIVWAIGDNYHFASDLMAGQEIDAMTPKKGYNIVSFDDSQPIGAKLKLLDSALTNETALQLKEKKGVSGTTILIFSSSLGDNKNLIDKVRSAAAQVVKEKASAPAAATNTSSSMQSLPSVKTITSPPVVNSSNTTTIMSNTTGNETLTLTENSNATATNKNQTTTIGTNKSVNQ